MKVFKVDVYELHHSEYLVEAKDRGEAVAKFFAGGGTMLDDSQEYIEGADRYGKTPKELGFTPKEMASLKAHDVTDEALSGIRGVEDFD